MTAISDNTKARLLMLGFTRGWNNRGAAHTSGYHYQFVSPIGVITVTSSARASGKEMEIKLIYTRWRERDALVERPYTDEDALLKRVITLMGEV
jgi:hypothetical protein